MIFKPKKERDKLSFFLVSYAWNVYFFSCKNNSQILECKNDTIPKDNSNYFYLGNANDNTGERGNGRGTNSGFWWRMFLVYGTSL
jgi:hypothetical protein